MAAPNKRYLIYSALVAPTNVLLALSSHPSAVVVIAETMPEAQHQRDVAHPSYPEPFSLASIDASEFPRWSWTRDRTFIETPPQLLTNEVRAQSRLAVAKIDAISRIIYRLNFTRYPVRTGVEFQETVYLSKRTEAERFKAAGYDESSMFEFPYVLQYADFAGISLRQAADDILFKAKLDDDVLAKTELLRLKYFHAVKTALTPEDLPHITESFVREFYLNSLV